MAQNGLTAKERVRQLFGGTHIFPTEVDTSHGAPPAPSAHATILDVCGQSPRHSVVSAQSQYSSSEEEDAVGCSPQGGGAGSKKKDGREGVLSAAAAYVRYTCRQHRPRLPSASPHSRHASHQHLSRLQSTANSFASASRGMQGVMSLLCAKTTHRASVSVATERRASPCTSEALRDLAAKKACAAKDVVPRACVEGAVAEVLERCASRDAAAQLLAAGSHQEVVPPKKLPLLRRCLAHLRTLLQGDAFALPNLFVCMVKLDGMTDFLQCAVWHTLLCYLEAELVGRDKRVKSADFDLAKEKTMEEMSQAYGTVFLRLYMHFAKDYVVHTHSAVHTRMDLVLRRMPDFLAQCVHHIIVTTFPQILAPQRVGTTEQGVFNNPDLEDKRNQLFQDMCLRIFTARVIWEWTTGVSDTGFSLIPFWCRFPSSETRKERALSTNSRRSSSRRATPTTPMSPEKFAEGPEWDKASDGGDSALQAVLAKVRGGRSLVETITKLLSVQQQYLDDEWQRDMQAETFTLMPTRRQAVDESCVETPRTHRASVIAAPLIQEAQVELSKARLGTIRDRTRRKSTRTASVALSTTHEDETPQEAPFTEAELASLCAAVGARLSSVSVSSPHMASHTAKIKNKENLKKTSEMSQLLSKTHPHNSSGERERPAQKVKTDHKHPEEQEERTQEDQSCFVMGASKWFEVGTRSVAQKRFVGKQVKHDGDETDDTTAHPIEFLGRFLGMQLDGFEDAAKQGRPTPFSCLSRSPLLTRFMAAHEAKHAKQDKPNVMNWHRRRGDTHPASAQVFEDSCAHLKTFVQMMSAMSILMDDSMRRTGSSGKQNAASCTPAAALTSLVSNVEATFYEHIREEHMKSSEDLVAKNTVATKHLRRLQKESDDKLRRQYKELKEQKKEALEELSERHKRRIASTPGRTLPKRRRCKASLHKQQKGFHISDAIAAVEEDQRAREVDTEMEEGSDGDSDMATENETTYFSTVAPPRDAKGSRHSVRSSRSCVFPTIVAKSKPQHTGRLPLPAGCTFPPICPTSPLQLARKGVKSISPKSIVALASPLHTPFQPSPPPAPALQSYKRVARRCLRSHTETD